MTSGLWSSNVQALGPILTCDLTTTQIMIEWIIGSAVGSLVALGVGAALYERRRQVGAIREAGRRLGLEVIETTPRR